MKKSTFLRLVLATLLLVSTHIGMMEVKRAYTWPDEELAMMYTVDKLGEGNYEIKLGKCDDCYISFVSYKDGEACCIATIDREYYTDLYKD